MSIVPPRSLRSTARGASSPVAKLAAICVFAGIANANLLVGPAIASQLASQYHFSAAQIGLFFSLEFAGYIVAGLAGIFLLPQLDWRRVAAIAVVGILAGNVATIYTLNYFPVLLVVRLLTASCNATLSVVALGTATQCKDPSRAVGLHILGQLATGVIGLAGVPYLFSLYGLSGYFALNIVVLAAASPGVMLLTSRGTTAPPPGQTPNPSLPPVLWLRHPFIFVFYVALAGIWTFAGRMGSAAGISVVATGQMLSAASLAGVGGAIIAAIAGERMDPRIPIVAGFLLLVFASAGLIHVASASQFLISLLVFKFAWSFALPFALALIGKLDQTGRMIAVLTIEGGLGLAIGPALAGYLVQSTGTYFWMAAIETLLLLGATLAIGTIAFALSEKRQPQTSFRNANS